MAAKIRVPATIGQIKQLGRKGADVIEKAIIELSLDEDAAGRVINKIDEFAKRIHEITIPLLNDLSVPDKLKKEEVITNFGNIFKYKIKDIKDQEEILKQIFPELAFTNRNLLLKIENKKVKLPKKAEDFFLIPNWTKRPNYFGSSYCSALSKVQQLIQKANNGKFSNYLAKDKINEKHIRQSSRTQTFFNEISIAQGNPDILIVPAQFGMRHRGRSVRHLDEVYLNYEFGLGSFEIGVMLLTNPERLKYYDDLRIDCAGDEFSPQGDGSFTNVPYYYYDGGSLGFHIRDSSGVSNSYGSVTAFNVKI